MHALISGPATPYRLVAHIRRPVDGASTLEMRSLAAIIIGSLAHSASSPTLLALLRGGAPAALLSAVVDVAVTGRDHTLAHGWSAYDSIKMLETLLRALRAVMTAVAEEICPNSRFGMTRGSQWLETNAPHVHSYRTKSHREPNGWDMASAGFESSSGTAQPGSHLDAVRSLTGTSQSLTPREELMLLARDAIADIFSSENLPFLLGPLFLAPIPHDDRSDHTFKHARAVSSTRNHSPLNGHASSTASTSAMAIDEPYSPSPSMPSVGADSTGSSTPMRSSRPIPLEAKTRIHTIVETVAAIVSACLNVPGPGRSVRSSSPGSPAEEIAERRMRTISFQAHSSPFYSWAATHADQSDPSNALPAIWTAAGNATGTNSDPPESRSRNIPNGPGRIAGSVLELLLEAAESGMPKTQEAALWALTELTQNNADTSAKLFKCQTSSGLLPTTMLLSMRNEPSPSIRLAAFFCLAHIIKVHPFTRKTNERVLAALVSLLDVPGDIRSSAALALAHVVADQPELQTIACEAEYDTLSKLGMLLKAASHDISASVEGNVPHSTSPHAAHRLREAVLTALAALTFSKDELRRQFVNHDQPSLVPLVVPLISSGSLGTRIAACRLIRALSRSISILRTNLVDAGVGEQLIKVLKDEDEHLDVQTEAAATICNLVLSFSPMRTYLLQNGAVTRIVDLCRSSSGPMRMNALWAVKNVIFASDLQFKRSVMDQLGFDTLRDLAMGHRSDQHAEIVSDLQEEDAPFREQALNIIRNLASNRAEDVEMTIAGFGGADGLFKIVEEAIWQRENGLLVEQAAYILVNITAANTPVFRRMILDRPNIVDALCFFLGHPRSQVRIAGILVAMHLTQPLSSEDCKKVDFASLINAIDPSLTSLGGSDDTQPSAPDAGASGSVGEKFHETASAAVPLHLEAVSILKNFGYSERLQSAAQSGERDVADKAKILLTRFEGA